MRHVLAARVGDYEPEWLDHLFLSGELVWGRLRPPRRDEADGPSMAALTRTVPISLLLREDLPWLLLGVHTSRMDVARDAIEDERLNLNCAWYADIIMTLTLETSVPKTGVENR